jgi:hypothetical protein
MRRGPRDAFCCDRSKKGVFENEGPLLWERPRDVSPPHRGKFSAENFPTSSTSLIGVT